MCKIPSGVALCVNAARHKHTAMPQTLHMGIFAAEKEGGNTWHYLLYKKFETVENSRNKTSRQSIVVQVVTTAMCLRELPPRRRHTAAA